MTNKLPLNSIRVSYIFAYIFFAEFSYFFALPMISSIKAASALKVGGIFSMAIIIESILMIVFPSVFRKVKFSVLFLFSSILMASAYLSPILNESISGWYGFFAIMSIAKALGKPYTRTVLSRTEGFDKERLFVLFSFFQNFAIVVAPILSQNALEQRKPLLLGFIFVYFIFALVATFIFRRLETTPQDLKSALFNWGTLLTNKLFSFLVVSNFLAYILMGMFITGTVLFSKFLPQLESYVGLFFSIVGVTVCIWQLFLSKMKFIKLINPKTILISTALFTSGYFFGNLYFSIFALVSYSVFEATLIPKVYSEVGEVVSEGQLSQSFALLLIAANAGDGIGSFLTGSIVDVFGMNGSMPLIVLTVFIVFMSVASYLWAKSKIVILNQGVAHE